MGSRNKNKNDIEPTPRWKEFPPGPEQKELNKLFEEGAIGDHEMPNQVREKHALFKRFSARIFGIYFRKTKAKFGLMCKFSVSKKFKKLVFYLNDFAFQ